METIIVNGKECALPEDRKLDNIVKLYSDILEGDNYFVVLNGKTVNSILNSTDIEVKAGDELNVYPLVIGG